MRLLEHEAKTILKRFNLPVPRASLVVSGGDAPDTPVVLKSQVPVGGRGKAGGVVLVRDNRQMTETIDQLFGLDIKGFKPMAILAEEILEIESEFYLSLVIDRNAAAITLMANKNGGVDVEDQTDFKSWQVDGTRSSADVTGALVAEYFRLESHQFALQDLIENLVDCFIKSDATLLEINPLVLIKDGDLVAGDCKMELDDAAAFRHPDWSFQDVVADTNFVELSRSGNVATIANGAGLAMATVDAVADSGLKPANFLDIGGGASEESVLLAFERIMEYDGIRAIVINIFAGITRCDEVAKAIIAAQRQLPNLPPLFIRLAGTNFEQAKQLLEERSITLLPTLEQCISAAKKEIEG